MLKVHLDPYMRNETVLFYTSYCSSNRSNSCLSLLYQYFFIKRTRVYTLQYIPSFDIILVYVKPVSIR